MSLRRAAMRGAIVLSTTSFGGSFLSLLALLVLARLVSPGEFGQVALAATLAELLFIVASWSLATALIREPDESVQAAFDAALFLLALLTTALLGAGAVVAAVMWIAGYAQLAAMFAVIVGARALTLFAHCFAASLDRQFAFGRVAVLQSATLASGLVAAVALAAGGAGVWALVGREVAGACVLTVLALAFSDWRPTRRRDRGKERELARFGATMTVSRLGDVLFHRFDNLVVGAFAGTRELGLYAQAYNTAETANKVYMPILAYVPLPAYARVQGDAARTGSAFRLVTYVMTRSIPPIVVVLIAFPREVLSVLFGERWAEAGPMLPWLAIFALVLPLFTHMRELLIANGAVGRVLIARVIQLAVFLPLVTLLSIVAGGRGASIAACIGMIIGTLAIGAFVRSFVDFSWRELGRPGLAAIASWLTASVAPLEAYGELGTVALGAVVTLAVYSVVLLVLEGRSLFANARAIAGALALRRTEVPEPA